MLRAVVATFALTLIVAPAYAQSHPGSHTMSHPHDSLSHPQMDPTLHALLHGTWTGTLVSPRGSGELRLSVRQDSVHGAMVKVVAASGGFSDNASALAIRGDTLRWRQEVADKTCPATAVLNTLNSTEKQSLTGSLACEGGDMTFVLHKTGG